VPVYAALSLASASPSASASASAQSTTTTINLTTSDALKGQEQLPTGQKSVPVISHTTNGTIIEQAAPADAIMTLVNTLFAIALPAVSGFILAVVAAIKGFRSNKKLERKVDLLINKIARLESDSDQDQDQDQNQKR
jgi:predicted PurR-regulated permease PerM